jgi:SPP1 gp7 family putative phage head morphogenesis protein
MDPDTIVDQLGLDLGRTISTLMRRFYPLLLRQAWADAGEVLELDLTFSLTNPLVQTLLGELAEQVQAVAETTRTQIRDLVGRQAAEGWSVEQLAKEIRQLGEIETPRRAKLIAVTETASAYSRGSIAAYRESGVVQGLRWLTADSPCEICDPLDDTVAPLGEAFAGGVTFPPAHPGCRCAIAPVV